MKTFSPASAGGQRVLPWTFSLVDGGPHLLASPDADATVHFNLPDPRLVGVSAHGVRRQRCDHHGGLDLGLVHG